LTLKGQIMTSNAPNDLENEEPNADLIVEVAGYVRQIRLGKPLDAWDWAACTQVDVDAARKIVESARRHLLGTPQPGNPVAMVRTAEDRIIQAISLRDKKLAALYANATVANVSATHLALTFRFPAHARLIAQQPAAVLSAISEVTGLNLACLVIDVRPSTPPTSQMEE
jgi:hypothetical protein